MGPLPPLGEMLRARLWPVPALAVVLAVALGVGLPRLDARIRTGIPPSLADYLFGGDPDAARALLAAIAGSLITATTLTLSLTVVTLQLASSQFSPRLLRTFSQDGYVQATLALFLATFTYALTVLRTVRSGSGNETPALPQVSITVAFLLTLASMFVLVVFLSHLARKIRVETMLRDVHVDADTTIRRLLPEAEADPAGTPPPAPPEPPAGALPLLAASSGFLSAVDEGAILSAAIEADAVVLVDRSPGSSLISGTPVGAVWPRTGRPFAPEVREELVSSAARTLTTEPERTPRQDVSFGLRQLTDVATRALSPGINDPTTAVHALSHSSALLCELARRDPSPRLLHDDRGRIRVVLRRANLAELLRLGIAQPLCYGAAEPAVLARLLMLLRELAWHSRPEQRAAIVEQLTRVRDVAAGQELGPADRADIAALTALVEQALTGEWPPATVG
ncbi:DUF2254 domain-containing protein [Streptomyces sp. NPDC058872]|uniref:DUF2254 domain-containing protein n=1 Tax=Streptomyces sp. NPDC058872 TaxID=3346661 RepID=UPI003682BA9D